MILSGLWPFGLLCAASSLDSPFTIAKTRSDRTGKVLADALANRVQGERPVTLVGFGLGARVLYSCILQLAVINAFGLVERESLALQHGSNKPNKSRDVEEEDGDEQQQHTIRMMDIDDPLTLVDPSLEPDYGPDRETVRFGFTGGGFDVKWEYGR